MEAIVPRTRAWSSTYALVVISPATTTSPVAVRVSQATRLNGSSARQASSTASEIWSAILSGCPSVTDSDVKRYGSFCDKLGCGKIGFSFEGRGMLQRQSLQRARPANVHKNEQFAASK